MEITEFMSLPYKMELTPDLSEGGYVISYPELPGCISQGETIEDAVKNGIDAKREWFKAAIASNYSIPVPNELEQYSGQFKLRIPKTLHKKLAFEAKKEGISMNQYCLYLLSKN